MESEDDSQADGFVVDDGYLSEGEGGPMDADEFGAGLEGQLCKSLTSGWQLLSMQGCWPTCTHTIALACMRRVR